MSAANAPADRPARAVSLAGASAPTVRRLPPAGSQKYEALLDTAEQRFGELGFKKANVDDIAARAGISKPLIYRYFSSKEELFEVVVGRVVTQWCDAITMEAERATPSAGHNLRLVVTESIGFARRRPVLRGLLARENQSMLYGYSDVLNRGTAALEAVIRHVLERGLADVEIRDDVDVEHMTLVVSELCHAFVNRVIAGSPDDEDPRVVDAVVETVLYGVVAKPRAHQT